MKNKLIELINHAKEMREADAMDIVRESECDLFDKLAALRSEAEYIADHLIANGVVVAEWIPASERLPDELPEEHPAWTSHIRPSKNVLVKRRDDDHLAVAWYSYGFDDWTDSYEQESFSDVTHWQELPEPPKGE